MAKSTVRRWCAGDGQLRVGRRPPGSRVPQSNQGERTWDRGARHELADRFIREFKNEILAAYGFEKDFPGIDSQEVAFDHESGDVFIYVLLAGDFEGRKLRMEGMPYYSVEWTDDDVLACLEDMGLERDEAKLRLDKIGLHEGDAEE